MKTRQTIRFENGFELTLALDGERFLGIADVRYDLTPLRNPELPWIFYTESDRGFRFEEFRLVDVEKTDSGAVIVFTSQGSWLPRAQEADAMGDARMLNRRLKKPTAIFRWAFTPITEKIWEEEWTGLAMQLCVESPEYPIHWMIEDTTWEIGGAAAGCVLVQQDVSSIDLEQHVKPDSRFSTIERFHSPGKDAAVKPGELSGGFPMDMLPRCAGASPLDFQVKDDLTMCLFTEKPGLTRARLEKFADENVIHYTDRPFFPLTEKALLPERKLLVRRHPGILAQHEWRNLWLDCFTEVRRRIHENYGFRLEIPQPQLWVFLWSSELNAHRAAWTDALRDALPEYKRLGYHDVFTHGVWEGPCSGPNNERGNICCNYDYVYSEDFGGAPNMKRLFDEAHEQGIRMWQWFGMQFDAGSPLWEEHPDWLLREANGDPWDGNYQTLYCGRFRSEFRDHLLQRIKQVKDDTGLDGIFWDSYQNLGVTCVDWQAPDKAPQAEEIWRMQSELQQHGYSHRCEVVTIFGISQVGMYGFEDEEGEGFLRRTWNTCVANDEYFAWLDCSPAFFYDYAYTADKVSPDIYFKFMGHRSVLVIDARPWGGGFLPGKELAEDYARVNHLYHAALPHMHRLRVTESGKYTLWLDDQNNPAVIWTFEDAEAEYTGPVTDLESGEKTQADGPLPLKAGHVYRLGE